MGRSYGAGFVRRMIPRKVRAVVVVVTIAVAAWRPDLAVHTVSWIWEIRAERMLEVMTGTTVPDAPPTH